MITVDISNVWGLLSLPDLLAAEKEVFDAHMALTEGSGEGSDYLGWLKLPTEEETAEIRRIRAAANRIRANSDVLVVIGIGGSCLGPRAAIELMQGCNRNLGRGKGDPQILFAGNTLSTRAWNELVRLLEGKDFSIAIISKSGTTTEPAIATRALRWLLERKYGTAEAKKRTYAITDPIKGALRQVQRDAAASQLRRSFRVILMLVSDQAPDRPGEQPTVPRQDPGSRKPRLQQENAASVVERIGVPAASGTEALHVNPHRECRP